MAESAPRKRSNTRRGEALTVDQALVGLFIGAMNANDHVAPAEAARAHHLIWSTRRFRRRSGESVNKLIGDMRDFVGQTDPREVVIRAAKVIPANLKAPALAVLVDLLLADGTLQKQERRFLRQVAAELKLSEDMTDDILDVVVLKNSL